MFCSNCGKEIEDGAKFCSVCGHAMGSGFARPNIMASNNLHLSANTGKKLVFLALIILSTVLSAVSTFMPVISAKVNLYFERFETSCNIFDLFDLTELIEEYGGSVGFFKLIFLVCMGLSIIICIAGIKFIYDVFSGVKGEDLLNASTLASGFCVIRFILIFIVVLLINNATSEELYGAKFLSVSGWAWVTVICAIINMALFSRMYSESLESEKERSMSKICSKCGTQFVLGEVCPKCGTQVK